MKKVLILQLKGKTYGGVWQVNKLIGEALIDESYEVRIGSIRNYKNDMIIEHDKRLKLFTINEVDNWGTYQISEIINELKKLHIIKSIKMMRSRISHEIVLKKDTNKLHNYIYKYAPDYIIVSHYQILDMIPKKYLNKTINVQHSAFEDAIRHKATRKTLERYNGKIKYLWLTKKTMENAQKHGLTNNSYIYNAVRFKSKNIANVTKNKKLITIARLSDDKRIDIMIDIAKELFKDKKFKDWNLEIYGSGELEEELRQKINNHKQIKLMGVTNDPKKELLNSSINLNTSPYEGFALSILEANECGIPTVTFNFGESVNEEIIDEKTGIIATSKEDYIDKLKKLMLDEEKLKFLSKNAKEFSKKFHIENITDEWIKLFNEFDK